MKKAKYKSYSLLKEQNKQIYISVQNNLNLKELFTSLYF